MECGLRWLDWRLSEVLFVWLFSIASVASPPFFFFLLVLLRLLFAAVSFLCLGSGSWPSEESIIIGSEEFPVAEFPVAVDIFMLAVSRFP